MLLLGLFILILLPIFFIYLAGAMKENEYFKDDLAAGFIRFIFYIFAGKPILCDLIMIGYTRRLF